MGIEYYLIKPEKKEMFYLGKHFNGLDCIKEVKYCNNLDEADYPSCEDWEDFFWDALRNNWEYFSSCELTLKQTYSIIYQMYEWCVSDKVILDNDCSSTFEMWKGWRETGGITSILESIHSSSKDIPQ